MENGTLLNNTYRVLYPIGKGGLGEIYLGYHENLRKYVVIKKVKEHCTGLLNNRIEVDILKGLHHTYLPQVYDFIQVNNGIFTVMDYISGHDMKYYMEAGYRFEEEQLVLWMKQLCQVLTYLHSRKPPIIHCDIKPDNIMITEEGNICLIDFNISLDGENNKELVGLSSSFASPEQVRKAKHMMLYGSGDTVKMDERTDIYSAGAVFYYMMSGRRPDAQKGVTVPLKWMDHTYSDSFANIVDKAMLVNPAKRFRSAGKMLNALEHKEKWESRYLKLWRTGILLDSLTGSLALILICFMILGYRGMRNEEFFRSYDYYMETVDGWMNELDVSRVSGDESQKKAAEEIVDGGIKLLNNEHYQKKFRQNEAQKADILLCVGQGFLYLEEYSQAETYLEEALEYETGNPQIYRNLAVAQANLGKSGRAQRSLEKAMEEGLNHDEGTLLQAEIALAENAYETAWNYAVQILGSREDEIVERAACCIVESGKMLGNTEECVSLLEQLEEKASGTGKYLWIRKQGELCLQAYNDGKTEFLEKAVSCYEKLQNSGSIQLTDLYNLISCYMEQGQLKKARANLLSMQKNYPVEYKIPMYLAYIAYQEQSDISAKERNYSNVKLYFREACDICDKRKIDWKSDANMVQMEDIVRQLTEQGWME